MRSLVLGLLLVVLGLEASANEPLPKCTPNDGQKLVVTLPSPSDPSTYIVPASAAKFRTEVMVLGSKPGGGWEAVPYQVTVTIVGGSVRAESSTGEAWGGKVTTCGKRSSGGPSYIAWDGVQPDAPVNTRAYEFCQQLINLGLTPTILE